VLVDGSIVGDINEIVLKDREQLSEQGAMIIVTNIDVRNRELVSGPNVYTKGFLSLYDIDELFEKVENKAEKTIRKVLSDKKLYKDLDWNGLKSEIKDNCNRVVKSLSRKSPIIIPVIIDINGEDL